MPVRSLLALVALVALVAMLGACGGDSDGTATGVIIDVQSSSLTQLDSFTLRDNDGEVFVFIPAADAMDDPQEGLFPGHLRTHALAAEQVTVLYREENGQKLAFRLEHEGG